MSELSKDEINKIITEKLFGVAVDKCPNKDCGKFHSVYDFCNSDADIREARGKLAEKGLQEKFVESLKTELMGYSTHRIIRDSRGYYDDDLFNLIHASPEIQARAIVRVLEGI